MIKVLLCRPSHSARLYSLQIWSMKKNEDAVKKKPKTSAAQIRVQKGTLLSHSLLVHRSTCLPSDLTELDLPSTMKTEFADPADLLNFTLTITPDEGKLLLTPLWKPKIVLTDDIQ